MLGTRGERDARTLSSLALGASCPVSQAAAMRVFATVLAGTKGCVPGLG